MNGRVVGYVGTAVAVLISWAAFLSGGKLWGLGFLMGYGTGFAVLGLAVALHKGRG